MPKIAKKEIRQIVDGVIANVLMKLKINPPSKKTKKDFDKIAKEFSGILKHELKHRNKKSKASKNKGAKKVSKGAVQTKATKNK